MPTRAQKQQLTDRWRLFSAHPPTLRRLTSRLPENASGRRRPSGFSISIGESGKSFLQLVLSAPRKFDAVNRLIKGELEAGATYTLLPEDDGGGAAEAAPAAGAEAAPAAAGAEAVPAAAGARAAAEVAAPGAAALLEHGG